MAMNGTFCSGILLLFGSTLVLLLLQPFFSLLFLLFFLVDLNSVCGVNAGSLAVAEAKRFLIKDSVLNNYVFICYQLIIPFSLRKYFLRLVAT